MAQLADDVGLLLVVPSGDVLKLLGKFALVHSLTSTTGSGCGSQNPPPAGSSLAGNCNNKGQVNFDYAVGYNFQDEKIATVTIPAVAAGGVIGATFWLNTIRPPPPAGLGGWGCWWLVVTAGLGGLLTADSW